MKNLLFFGLLHFVALTSFGQETDFYYTFSDQKIILAKTSKHLVEFPQGYGKPNGPNIEPGVKLSDKKYLVSDLSILSNYNPNHIITPVYVTDDNIEIYYSTDIVLKFNPNVNTSIKTNLISSLNLSLIKSTVSYEQYLIGAGQDALQVSKTIYETGIVDFCTPNFIVKAVLTDHIPNDPYFNQQWYLHNTGQGTNDGKSTTIDADIDAPEAWEITKGSPDIIIAVLDEGITSNHPDLPNTRQVRLNGSNFAYQYDGTNNPNDPSPNISTILGYNHGNACAGIIGATQDNNIGISGIAPFCKIMPVKLPFEGGAPISLFADGINFAVSNGADILSNSWILIGNFPVVASAVNNAIDNEVFVVFGTGNTANRIIDDLGSVGYPGNANISKLIAVGASDRNNIVANYSPNSVHVDIAAPSHSAYDVQIPGESYNIWTIDIPGLDYGNNSFRDPDSGLPAIGEILPNSGTNYADFTGRMGGTSAAAPQVAAVLGLMKSVNTCLSYNELRDVLLKSADKVGGYNYNWSGTYEGHSKELGYGKLNAHKAVLLTQQLNTPTLDLMVRDGLDDLGIEPNTFTPYMWDSSDIWVRNNQSLVYEHQNPEYGTYNYVNVRVTNKSCVASTGTEQLKLYWTKAATSQSWDYNWSGNNYPNNGPIIGDIIGTMTIPVIQPNEERTVQFGWSIPNPEDYEGLNPSPWHFCLLARIESANDPMTFTESTALTPNVANNNNIAWKNVTVVDIVPNAPPSIPSGVVAVGNPFNITEKFTIKFSAQNPETGKKIFDEAEVGINLDPILLDAWKKGGMKGNSIQQSSDASKLIITGDNASLENLTLTANQFGTLNLSFNFLTKEITEKEKYIYRIIQNVDGGDIIGGETYEIRKQPRGTLFYANAGEDKQVNKNEMVDLNAEPINEPADYFWYDNNDNMLHEGVNFSVSIDSDKAFKLEVIAKADGYKDYDVIDVRLKPNTLQAIHPNPADDELTVNYIINKGQTASITVTGIYGSIDTYTYALDIDELEKIIDIKNYLPGIYSVALVCDGNIIDQKTLLKQ